MYGGQLSNRREEADSSGKTPDGVTSPGESNVNPETCKNKVLAKGYDLVEVRIDIDNHEQKLIKCVSIHSCFQFPILSKTNCIIHYYPILSRVN